MSTLNGAVSLFRDLEIDQDFIRESDIDDLSLTGPEFLKNKPRYRKISKLYARLHDFSLVSIPQEESVRKILPQPKED